MRQELDLWRNPGGKELFGLSRRLNRLFDDWFTPVSFLTETGEGVMAPPCDLDETDTHYLLCMDLPGVDKKDLHIEVLDDEVHISGERQSERSEEKGQRRLIERSHGRFDRTFTLPSGVSAEKVEAQFQNGVLRIAIPKGEEVKAHRVEIKEGASGVFQPHIGSKQGAKKTEETSRSDETSKPAARQSNAA